MTKQGLLVELDDETIRYLTVLGDPSEVLAHMALAAAEGVGRPGRPKREQTNESLRLERDKSDIAITMERAALDEKADDVVRVARQRADEIVQTARHDADGERGPRSTANEASSVRARTVLEQERHDADGALEAEREERKSDREGFLTVERGATDKDLTGERTHADTLVVDQREANAKMVQATIRAQELAVEAREARDRAEKSELELRAVAEFREMFIGILGHDLRNPLGSITLAATFLLRRGNLDEEGGETVARILRSSQRINRMIHQLLDLTRARLGGGMPIEPEPTDVADICRNVVDEFEVTIELVVEGDLTGTWDKDRLEEALSNIAGNAIEYAAPGTAVIVKAHPDGAEVVVEVSNQGAPIPPDVLPFIFEPFRRVQLRGKAPSDHLGLGLYIAHQIVVSHGGTLAARSADGMTTFVIRLPRGAP
jgi:signal transduction histidine kinase